MNQVVNKSVAQMINQLGNDRQSLSDMFKKFCFISLLIIIFTILSGCSSATEHTMNSESPDSRTEPEVLLSETLPSQEEGREEGEWMDIYENPEIPVSCVRIGYVKFDEVSKNDIRVEYVQLSRLPQEEIKTNLNEKLMVNAFSEWDVDSEQNLELYISQTPFVYKNYLSVKRIENGYQDGATHPWQDLSAKTFDLKTGNEVSFTEFVQVDDNLKEKIYKGMFICSKLSHKEAMEWGFYDALWNSILISREMPEPTDNFYLEDGNLVFVLGAPHVMGDYITFEIALEDLPVH